MNFRVDALLHLPGLICFVLGLLTGSAARAQSTPSFGLWVTIPVQLGDPQLLMVDFNNDRRLDMLLHGLADGNLRSPRSFAFTNRHDGEFGRLRFFYTNAQFPSFALGDWNRDGWVDFFGQEGIVSRTSDGFHKHLSIRSEHGYRAWIDFDADGDLDAASSRNLDKPGMALWEQGSGGIFTKLHREFPNVVNIIKGDFDADGRMDWLPIPDGETNRLVPCLNTGSSDWVEKELVLPKTIWIAAYERNQRQGVSFDYNNDGWTDILLNPLTLLRNTGETLELADAGLPFIVRTTLAVGDINHDRYSDLIVSSEDDGPALFLNQDGTGFVQSMFQWRSIERYGVVPRCFQWNGIFSFALMR